MTDSRLSLCARTCTNHLWGYGCMYRIFVYVFHNICVRCVSNGPMIVARIFRCNQMQLSMYDGTINIEDMIPTWIPCVRCNECIWCVYARARDLRWHITQVRERGMRWTTRLLCVPLARLSWEAGDFFSDDDQERGRTEGKVQRFGISTFYADSALVNPCWWLRILKKRIAALRFTMPFETNSCEHSIQIH